MSETITVYYRNSGESQVEINVRMPLGEIYLTLDVDKNATYILQESRYLRVSRVEHLSSSEIAARTSDGETHLFSPDEMCAVALRDPRPDMEAKLKQTGDEYLARLARWGV